MLHSIRGRLALTAVVMAAMLGVLVFLVATQLANLDTAMGEVRKLEEFKTHVLVPQKDMNEFLGKMDTTILLLELGEAEHAQEVFADTADAELDINEDFAFMEENAPETMKTLVTRTHQDWEVATEFLKVRAEKIAAGKKIALTRPENPDLKADEHVEAAPSTVAERFGKMTPAEMANVSEEVVETADEGIDTTEEEADKVLAAAAKRGDTALASTRQLTLASIVVVILGIMLLALVSALSIVRPLLQLKAGAQQIADGNLDYEFKDVRDDEIGAVIHAVQAMAHSLKDRIRNLEEVAGVVVITSDDICAAAEDARAAGAGAEAIDAVIGKAEVLKALVGQALGAPVEVQGSTRAA